MFLVLNTLGEEEDVIELQLVILILLHLHQFIITATVKRVDLSLSYVLLHHVCSRSLGGNQFANLTLGVRAKGLVHITAELTISPGLSVGHRVHLVVGVSSH